MLGLFTKIKSEILVGMLVVVAIGLVIYSSIKVTGFNSFTKKGYKIEMIFDDVSGLSTQTAVRIAGIQVGKILAIELVNNRAKVILYIFEDYLIPNDSVAQIQTLGLLGDKYIEIIAGTNLATLKNGQSMRTSKAQGLDAVLANISDLIATLTRVVANNEVAINQAVTNFKDLSVSLKSIAENNASNINQITANFKDLSVSLNRIVENNEQKVNDLIENVKNFSTELNSIAEAQSLQKSVSNIESITKKIDEGEGTLGQLVNKTDTIEKINSALDDLNNLLGSASRWTYDVGFETKFLTKQNQFKPSFSLKINTQKDRFYQLKLTSHPIGKISEETTTKTVTDASGAQTITTTQATKITDDYLISLQIAKKFYDTQFRIGLFENDFGVGVDQFFGVKNQWRLTSEVFNFQKNQPPYLSFDAIYNYRALRFSAGFDDVLNENQNKRDFTIGAGLEFNEDDLKILGASAISGGLSP